jgi:hypothetical protein
MPQINRSEANASVGATAVQENKLFRERLMDRFKPSDFVRVKNIDDEDFQWKWMPTTAEEVSMDDGGQVRIIEGRESFSKDFKVRLPGREQIWQISAGKEEVIIGENAYLFIEGLYKTLVSKSVVQKNPDSSSARNFNWTDGAKQEEMIDKIFIRKEQPTFGGEVSSNGPARTTAKS